VKIIIENRLPVVMKNPIPMGQVFQNLIGNSIRFMDKPEGIVRVGCEDEGTHWKLSVSDNGPGIDRQYHDKIFQIFQTLAPRDDHESTGIGLTLVKKIIELYGSSIRVESETGHGSKFLFSLPKEGKKDAKRQVHPFG
jgi:two-component system sensor kinase FixL